MIKIPLTRQQYSAKVLQLAKEQGVTLTGDTGTVSKLGCTIDYDYDGVELTIEVKDHPFLFSKAHIEAIVLGWLSANPAAASPSAVATIAVLLLMAMSFLFAPTMNAQTVSQSVSDIYLGGLSWNPSADQKLSGTAIYGHELSAGTYGVTVADFLPGVNHTVTTNVGVGIAQRFATIANQEVYGTGATAISFSSTATGWSWGGGLMVPKQIRGNWYIAPTLRFLKSNVSGAGYQVISGVTFGWGSKPTDSTPASPSPSFRPPASVE